MLTCHGQGNNLIVICHASKRVQWESFMKKSAFVLGLAAAAMVPASAMAQLAPGEYSLGGIQQVCINIPGNN